MTGQGTERVGPRSGLTESLWRQGIEELRHQDPELYRLLEQELQRQNDTLSLMAASSLASPGVLACAGSAAMNVTGEGYPGHRFHGGCAVVDGIESLAIERARQVFAARYANVQPHSGSQANASVLLGLLDPGDVIVGMDLDAGGHLTHGAPVSFSGRFFRAFPYGVGADGRIDYDEVARLCRQRRPRLLICGGSSYPRRVDFERFREIADDVGAFLLADISHVSGLVAAGLHPSPIDVAHFTTTSTYKQLYGPRGGLILLGREADTSAPSGGTLADLVERAVFPGAQGTPDLAAIAAKARALDFVAAPGFRELAERIVADAEALAGGLDRRGYRLVSGGTDTHMILVDLSDRGLTGAAAQAALEQCGIVANKNKIPGDPLPATVTSGLRLGTNQLAWRGLGPGEMEECAEILDRALESARDGAAEDPEARAAARSELQAGVKRIVRRFPLPGYPQQRPAAVPGASADALAAADTLHELFHSRARRAPERPAVHCREGTLDYGDLDSLSDAVAAYLRRSLGVGPEDRVAIMVRRSERLPVAILGILKAGAAYVPVDPALPAPMVRQILRDSSASAALVDSDFVGAAAAAVRGVFVMDMELDGLPPAPGPVEGDARGNNLAYMIYTSGSTGPRKGVEVEHRAILETLRWRHGFYGLDPSMVTLQLPSAALDSSVLDIFSTLCAGGRLVIPPEEFRTDVFYLGELARRRAVTHLLATPSLYRLLLPGLEGVDSLRTVTLAGETVNAALVREHFSRLPSVELVNEYGPTENAVCSTATRLDRQEGDTVPIGRPIGNVRLHLLDEEMRPVADGEPGEIFLGGPGLARGYHGRPGLTAASWLPDPFADTGRRLYRTGDMARRVADGRLEFLRRRDDQVKIRGHRVELGEVAAALRALEGIEDAVAACRTRPGGARVLVGYVVSDRPVEGSRLRDELRRHVAPAVVPDVIVQIDEVPLTTNGKVDREALPHPGGVGLAKPDGRSVATTMTEQELADIWADILGVSGAGLTEDFFDLGGNSLAAARLQTEIRGRMGIEMSLPIILENSTIQALARHLDRTRGAHGPA